MRESRNHVELSNRAKRDLKAIPKNDRTRVAREIAARLAPNPLPGNADVDAIAGHAPWMRLRWRDYRVVYRPLRQDEMDRLRELRGTLNGPTGYLVERIVNRRDLHRAVKTLEFGASL